LSSTLKNAFQTVDHQQQNSPVSPFRTFSNKDFDDPSPFSPPEDAFTLPEGTALPDLACKALLLLIGVWTGTCPCADSPHVAFRMDTIFLDFLMTVMDI
jgi:hypothetical protein